MDIMEDLYTTTFSNNEEFFKKAAAEIESHRAQIAELKAELETERMRLAACGVAALGYFEGCKDEYRSASLEDTLRLYAEHDELKAENERLSIRSELNADALADSRMFCDMKKIECRQLQEERDELTRQRDEAVQMLADWCDAVHYNGTGWDDWDEHYKYAAWRQCGIRELIDAARTT